MTQVIKGFHIIPKLFTEYECEQLLFDINNSFQETKANMYQDIRYNGRKCYRLLKDDKKFANDMFNRISKYLPKYYLDDFNDKWYPKGCNTLLRVIKYNPNCYFNYHHDGHQDFDYDKKTMASVTLSLNTVPKQNGGATTVIDPDEKGHTIHVQPIAGNVFMIDITNGPEHKGDILFTGLKYILRTDIVCELINPRNLSLRKEYYNLTNQIDKLQESGWKNNLSKIFEYSARLSEIEKIYSTS